MSASAIATLDSVGAFQRVLYRTAKAQPSRRFHALADKVHRIDVLRRAWVDVASNRGAAGVDGVTIAETRGDIGRLLQKRLQHQGCGSRRHRDAIAGVTPAGAGRVLYCCQGNRQPDNGQEVPDSISVDGPRNVGRKRLSRLQYRSSDLTSSGMFQSGCMKLGPCRLTLHRMVVQPGGSLPPN